MNKYIPPLLGSLLAVSSVQVFGADAHSTETTSTYATVSEECKQDNVYSQYVCDGIKAKKDFYDKWFRPSLPFYYKTIDKTTLPDPAWISPDFDPSKMDQDATGPGTPGSTTTNPATDGNPGLFPSGDPSACPPNCQ